MMTELAGQKLPIFLRLTQLESTILKSAKARPINIALNLRDEREIAVSSDGGTTWTNVMIPIHGSRKVEDLIVDHTDPMVMWIVYDKEYVYKTTDGGTTWTLYNQGIDTSLDLNCITHHVGNNGAVYLGGENMVYFRDNSMSDWTSYSTGLPVFITVKDIEVIYDIAKLRLSSNRSVWETDLNSAGSPKAAISAQTLEVNDCENLNIQFYDASFVQTSGTTWNWTFEGGSPATSTLQNPIVSYITSGNYDVSLQVTNGTSDTKTITDLIVVNNLNATSLPVYEDIENFTYSGVTGGCSPPVTLDGSLNNIGDADFPDDNTDWRVNNGPGISGTSGPLVDYTEGTSSGQYLYLRGSNGCGERTGAIITDCLDFNGTTNPTISFAYQAVKTNGTAAPELHVDIQSNGIWTNNVFEVLGEQGARNGNQSDWVVFDVDLTSFANTIVKIRIWGTSSTNGTNCDLALDGIHIYDQCPSLLVLTGSESGNNQFLAQKIESSQTIQQGADIEYDAGEEISLQVGFEVQGGAEFYAYIEGCSSAIQSISSEHNGLEKGKNLELNVEEKHIGPLRDVISSELKMENGNIPFKLELYNTDGKKATEALLHCNQYSSLKGLSKGTYIYKIENVEQGKIGVIVIE